jgi:sterol desaturase/sphingolipid hydroxylase (fatty acid hydroxylase superfamily)
VPVIVLGAAVSKRRLFRYESIRQPLLSRGAFARRVARHFAASSLLIGVSLLAGMAGYHWLEGMAWIDAFANAAMILSGMGPLAPMQTWGGKLFAGVYALYSGLVLIAAAGILFAPLLHRLLHSIHVETDEHG